jgi:transposase InsO family protein
VLVSPLAISRQNARCTSRRNDGRPGDFIGDRPVNATIHPAGLPINTSTIQALRGPLESTQYVSLAFGQAARDAGIARSMGSKGDCYDKALVS